MKARTIVLTLVTCFVGLTLCFAQGAFMGTWKLNESKSKIAPNAPKNHTVVYEAAGDSVKVTWMAPARMVNPRTTNGRASSMAKTTPPRAIRIQTCGLTRRLTTIHWGSTLRKAVRSPLVVA